MISQISQSRSKGYRFSRAVISYSVWAYGTLDLSRFDAAPLIAFTATKEMRYGTETDG